MINSKSLEYLLAALGYKIQKLENSITYSNIDMVEKQIIACRKSYREILNKNDINT